jgi:glutathione S-transferase
MESLEIAKKLEEIHPEPSLQLDSPYTKRVLDFLPTLLGSVRPIFMPQVPKKFLPPRSAEYFVSTREKSVGMSLDEYAKGAPKGWEDAKPHVSTLGEMYRENEAGPFLMGKEVSFSDFVVVGFLRMMDRLGIVDKFWEMDGGKELQSVYQACGKWFERDDH